MFVSNIIDITQTKISINRTSIDTIQLSSKDLSPTNELRTIYLKFKDGNVLLFTILNWYKDKMLFIFLGKVSVTDVSNIELLPYKDAYEIDFKFIQFKNVAHFRFACESE